MKIQRMKACMVPKLSQERYNSRKFQVSLYTLIINTLHLGRGDKKNKNAGNEDEEEVKGG